MEGSLLNGNRVLNSFPLIGVVLYIFDHVRALLVRKDVKCLVASETNSDVYLFENPKLCHSSTYT